MWTEERVGALKQLWSEGLSASRIAGQLGCVTRNAVLGKVHRMGLAGRATTSREAALFGGLTKRQRARIGRANALQFAARSESVKAAIARSRTTEAEWISERLERPSPRPPERQTVKSLLPPLVARVSFADLEDHHCRMPVGDPGDAGFGFCGQTPVPGVPYCEDCCKRVYQAANVTPPQPPAPKYLFKKRLAFA